MFVDVPYQHNKVLVAHMAQDIVRTLSLVYEVIGTVNLWLSGGLEYSADQAASRIMHFIESVNILRMLYNSR